MPFGGTTAWSTSCCPTSVNGGLHRICVLTQYKSHSLDRHISATWRLSSVLGQYIATVPAQQRLARTGSRAAPTLIFQSRT